MTPRASRPTIAQEARLKVLSIAALILAALTVCHAQVVDIGVQSIVWPRWEVDEGIPWHPSAYWRNFGTVDAEFRAWLAIYDSLGVLDYVDSTTVDRLAPDQNVRLYFRPYTPKGPLRSMPWWTVRCSTYAVSDANDANDVLADSFRVAPTPI